MTGSSLCIILWVIRVWKLGFRNLSICRNSPKDKWATDLIFLGFQCLDFESCSLLKGWWLQRTENFLQWCTLSFGDDSVFGPPFQPLTYLYVTIYKLSREKQEVFDIVPKFSAATEPGTRLVGFIPAVSFLVCLPDVWTLCKLTQRILEFQLWSPGEQEGCSWLQCLNWLVLCLR